MRFLLTAAIGLLASSTAFAGHHVRPGEVIVVHQAPAPAPVVMVGPPVFRPNYVWVDGYWVGRSFVPGHWELIRPAVALNVRMGPVNVAVRR